MRIGNKTREYPDALKSLLESFAYFHFEDVTSDDPHPVVEIENSFLANYTAAYKLYARPCSKEAKGEQIISDESAKELIVDNKQTLARHLAKLSYEMIAQFANTNGESIDEDSLRQYLEEMSLWNRAIVENCELENDTYTEELSFAIRCLVIHLKGMREIEQVKKVKKLWRS